MGKNYQSLKSYNLAEQNFILASHIVPDRIYLYYLLCKLHAENGKTKSAIYMAKKGLAKEPKVQSKAINENAEKDERVDRKRKDN